MPSSSKIVLLACGSFNPPTNMHLRMFEIARDHLHRMGIHTVVGGLISPVHDAYAKNELESATHRKEMVRLALRNSEWIKLSEWECNQESWSRTRQVLNYHQNHINEILQASLNDNNSNFDEESNWFTDNVRNGCLDTVSVKLLCGADLLESFGTPGLWSDEDIDAIVGKYGLVVITRNKTNPLEFIYNSDVLTKYMSNICIVTEWIGNEVSSTKVRRAIRRNESVKYLIPDPVIDYIQKKGLFGYKHNKYHTNFFDTHSKTLPMDVILTSPSSLSNCMNICNNNLFNRFQSNHNFSSIDTVDLSKKNQTTVSLANYKLPGQAVKVKMEGKTVQKGDPEKVGNAGGSSGNIDKRSLRNAKSSNDFSSLVKSSADFKSEDSLKNCKSCDENLIKFIFSKHGIEVISDVETIV